MSRPSAFGPLKHHEILGTSPGSTQEQIRKAYRKQVKRWHPDQFAANPKKTEEAKVRMQSINEAYEVLSQLSFEGTTAGFTRARHSTHFSETKPTPRMSARHILTWFMVLLLGSILINLIFQVQKAQIPLFQQHSAIRQVG